MPRTSFRQADLERILRAAKNTDCFVEIDLRSLTVKIVPLVDPASSGSRDLISSLAPDGEENWEAN